MRNSIVILSKGIKIDKNYNNVIDYSEENLLELLRDEDYLISETNNYSFVDEYQTQIIVQNKYADVYLCNYLAFQNPRYNNKWFFCFVDRIEYNSENSTKITFHTDIWSTWYNNLTLKESYVLREHVSDDTIGKHTIDEGLDVGGVVAESVTTDNTFNETHYICVATNWNPATKLGFVGAAIYTRVVWGSFLAVFPFTQEGITQYQYFVQQTNADGHPDDIHDIFIIPGAFIDNISGVLVTEEYDVTIGETVVAHTSFQRITHLPAGTNFWEAISANITITKKHSFTGLTLKNNKCYCYPYNYLLVTNNLGGINTYKYEDFSTATCVFERQLALSIGVSGRLVPKNYKGVTENLDETISLGKYPTCQWSSDSYTNWLTQNAVNIEKAEMNMDFTRVRAGTNLVQNAFNLQFGSAMTSMIESGMTLENQIADLQGEFYAGKLLPNKLGGSADGDVNFSSLDNGFKFLQMRAKNEYMLAIDNFFSRFGYKILRVKIPETNSRVYWNYLQIGTGESLGFGDIPQEALSGINQIVQKGTTIWHNHEIIGDYSLTNSIVTNN